MTILCGTDFSPLATQAIRVAGLIARRRGQRLHLVHVQERDGPTQSEVESRPTLGTREQKRLAREVERIKLLRIQVTTHVLSGRPDEILVEMAARLDAGLLVVGAVGHRPVERWLLGSCAERTAREAPIPVLVVREAQPFEEWLENGRPLRVVVGCEDGRSSDGALVWAGSLREIASIELIVARLVLPGVENQRAGVSGPGMGITLFAETEARLREELGTRKASLLGDMAAELRVIPALGRTDMHLVMAADDLGADVVVVGSHQREGFRRWWHGSVSSGVLHGAPMSVAVVPVRSAPPSPPADPRIERSSNPSP